MAIVPWTEIPSHCPLCGGATTWPRKQACFSVCTRVGFDRFTDVTTHRDVAVLHVHLACNHCGYMFRVSSAEPAVLERLE